VQVSFLGGAPKPEHSAAAPCRPPRLRSTLRGERRGRGRGVAGLQRFFRARALSPPAPEVCAVSAGPQPDPEVCAVSAGPQPDPEVCVESAGPRPPPASVCASSEARVLPPG
jgi:hypothetical protein